MTAMSQVWIEDVHRPVHGISVKITPSSEEGLDADVCTLPEFVAANEDITVDEVLDLLQGRRVTFGGGAAQLYHVEVIR